MLLVVDDEYQIMGQRCGGDHNVGVHNQITALFQLCFQRPKPIGTVRREFLDHILFWNATDLQRKLDSFQTYYNTERVHAARACQPPVAALENPISLRNC